VTSFPHGSYRRRIRLVASAPDTVEAGIEDDFHHFRLTLHHDSSRVRGIETAAYRIPWTTCGDAGAALQLLEGMPLERSCLAVGRWSNPRQQCTHMFDLAGLAAAHAYRSVIEVTSDRNRQYDATVPYGFNGGERRDVHVWRDRTSIFSWTIEGDRCVSPSPFSDVPFTGGFFRWADTSLPSDDAEAAIVLRRACTIGMGRGMDQDQWSTAADVSAGPAGVCYSQQPERRSVALRVRGNIRDFDANPDALLSNDPHQEDLAR
jgi:Protein of unknown function (DUF2889)